MIVGGGDEDDEDQHDGGGLLFDYFEITQAFFFNCIKFGKEEFI